MSARFYKMSGSGNDFVFVDGREHQLADWTPERIRQVCDRRRGVGADGVVHLSVLPDGAIRMIYYNADGSHADMCGNAALCATRLAVRLGLANPEQVVLATDAGRMESRCLGPGSAAELKFPTASLPVPVAIPLRQGELRAFQGTVGVPHTIVLVENVAEVDVETRGRELRYAPTLGAAGSNVNFIGPTGDRTTPWALRTYERGVEAETLACGTGTVAAALAVGSAGLATLPIQIRAGSGCVYSISGVFDGSQATDVWLCGEGRLVFSGEFELGL